MAYPQTIGSTAFMTAPGIFDSNLDKIDCSDILAAILLTDRATMGQIPMKGKAKNVEHYWIEDQLNVVTFTGTMQGSHTITIATPSTDSSVQVILRTGAIVYPEGKEWYARFGAAPVADSNVVAIYASSGFTAITSDVTWYVVQMPKKDRDTASDDISKSRVRRRNICQVFERGVEIEETRRHIDVWAVSNELKYQTQQRSHEIKRELNMSILMGHPKDAGSGATLYADAQDRTMAGFFKLIRDPNLDNSNEDTMVVNAAGASLSVDFLNSLCYTVNIAGGLDEKASPVFIMHPTQQRKFSGLDKSYRRDVEDAQRRKVGYYRQVFISDLGIEVPVITDRWFRRDALMLIDKNRAAITPLQGDQWHLSKMAKTGRSDKWQLSGQYTCELRNAAECHGLIINLPM